MGPFPTQHVHREPATVRNGARSAERMVRVEPIMGTAMRVEVADGHGHEHVIDEVFDWLAEVDARFSMWQPTSEMSRLARGELSEADVHPDIAEVLGMCEAVRIVSHGRFDIRRHRQDGLLDPTGLVKGWSVDRAGALLRAAGVNDWSINAGGDILVEGRPAPGEAWRVGIQHPHQRDAIATVVSGSDMAVATSGHYERGHHIVDPTNATATGSLLSVTVVGPTLALADAYATAAFAMGTDAPHWLTTLPDYEGCVITADDRLIWTEGMDRYRDAP